MNESSVISVMNEHKLHWLALEAARMKRMAERWSQLEDRVEGLLASLVQEMVQRQANGEPMRQADLLALRRYQLLLTQLEAERQTYRLYAIGEIESGQREFAGLAVQQAGEALTAVNEHLPTPKPPVGAIEDRVGETADGTPLTDVVLTAAVWAAILDALTRNTLQEVAAGRPLPSVLRTIKDTLAKGLEQAISITRMEQGYIHREFTRRVYQASGVVAGYYRLAKKDNRTCMACLADDGTFYPIDQPMPEHPKGRCSQVPAVIGFTKPRWQTGGDWFETLAESTQRDMMGNGRYQAWKDGQFNLRDLAVVRQSAGHPDSLAPAPLKELLAGG